MNFQPNFEQYKEDQKKIEVIPTIKADFHYVINDAAKKLIEQQPLSEKEIDDLEMVSDTAQDLEKELMISIDHFRSKEIITKAEFLVVFNYFLTANQNGPDSTVLKKEMIASQISKETFKDLCSSISIPEHTREVIVDVYGKMIQ